MPHLRSFSAIASLIAIAGMALGTIAIAAPASGPPVAKVGVIVAQIGPVADWGTALRRGTDLAVQDFNRGGGANGHPVEIVYCENEGKPDRAIECAKKLIQDSKVVALVGGAPSGSALAMLNIPQEQKIPYLNLSSSTAITTRYKDSPENFVFRAGFSDGSQIDVLLNWAKAHGYKRLGLLHDTTGFGLEGKNDFDKLAPQGGFTIVDDESFALTDTDMTPQLEKMRAAKPDAVLIYTIGGPASHVLESAKKIGYNTNWMGPWIFSAADFRRLSGNDGNGLHLSVPFTENSTKSLRAFHDRMMSTYHEDPMGIYTPMVYDGVTLLLQAIARSGNDPIKLRDAIESTNNFHGITAIPPHPFSKSDHDAEHAGNLVVGVLENGRVLR